MNPDANGVRSGDRGPEICTFCGSLIARVTGLVAFRDVKAQSITVEAFGREIVTLDLAVTQAKRASSQPKGLSALLELESFLEAGKL